MPDQDLAELLDPEYVSVRGGWAVPGRSIWVTRAARLLEKALDEIRIGDDPVHTVSAADAALRIEAGELDSSEMDGYEFPHEPPSKDEEEQEEGVCICPPDLLERGGHRGGCPVHGLA